MWHTSILVANLFRRRVQWSTKGLSRNDLLLLLLLSYRISLFVLLLMFDVQVFSNCTNLCIKCRCTIQVHTFRDLNMIVLCVCVNDLRTCGRFSESRYMKICTILVMTK